MAYSFYVVSEKFHTQNVCYLQFCIKNAMRLQLIIQFV